MTKAKFIMTNLKHLKATAKQFRAEFGDKVNGNRINAVVRKVEKEAYDSGLFATGEVSKHTLDHHGKPYQLQKGLDWRNVFTEYLKIA